MKYILFGLIGGLFYAYSTLAAPPAALPPSYPVLQIATSSNASYNWAGYVAQGGDYTGVSASWTVPAVAQGGSAQLAADATWVGIGGVASDDLLQAGTQAVADPQGGVSYEAWLEMMPGPSVEVPLAVKAGDQVAVSLSQLSAGQWQVSVVDGTSGKSYEKTVAYDSTNSSAEWIEEMPSTMHGSFIPLDDFTAAHFSGAAAVAGGQSESIAQTDAQPLIMISRNGEALAQTSVLGTDGGSFAVTRTEALAQTARTRPVMRRVVLILPSARTR